MKVNYPSAHILRAKRCRDSLARSPLASAATRDGAASGDDAKAREARDGDTRRRERTSRASMVYIRNQDPIAEDEANRARIDEAARRREGDGGSASMRAHGSEGDPWAEYAADVEREIFNNRSAAQKRRRAREAALGSPPMMNRATQETQAVAFEGWRAKKEQQRLQRFASPDVVHTFKAMLWSAVQRPFGDDADACCPGQATRASDGEESNGAQRHVRDAVEFVDEPAGDGDDIFCIVCSDDVVRASGPQRLFGRLVCPHCGFTP
ncbi:hypothetical protein BE221DRAFT_164225, partial [Ostreococcus tauri]